MVFKVVAAGLLIGLGFSSAAGADGTPAGATEPAVSTPVAGSAMMVKDPNRMVCEKVEDIGSRLSAHKVCMTSAEWTEQRRLDRALVDHIQAGSCVVGAGC